MTTPKKPPAVHLGVDEPACRRSYKKMPPLTLDPLAITCQNCLNLPTKSVELGSVFDLDDRIAAVLRTMWDGVQADREARRQQWEDQRTANEIRQAVIADTLSGRFGPPLLSPPRGMGSTDTCTWPIAEGIKVTDRFARITILWIDDDGVEYQLGCDLEADDPDLVVKVIDLVGEQLVAIASMPDFDDDDDPDTVDHYTPEPDDEWPRIYPEPVYGGDE